MEKAPRNTQMKGNKIRNKRTAAAGLGAEVKEEPKKHRFFFPVQQKTVLAESVEEATAIINKK